ncbi:hypothetical protein [Methylobacterium sp. SI9]|uniref:hypothetical protein n=1 Tax=Methylobacterium guangdongense TaxID=3138811 RepID=UPI00313B0FBC
MAAGVALPTVLQLLDGTPHKKVATAIFENLPLAKLLQGGDVSGLLKKVLADGNLSSVLQNPMAGLTQGLQDLAGQAAVQLQAALGSGASSLISALTGASGLTSALSTLQAAGDNLVGLTNGQAGLMALAGHDSLLSMLGDAAPATMALSQVLGPTASADLLNGITGALPGVVQSVIAGAMSVADATAWVQGQSASVAAVVSASASALTQGAAIQMQASAVSTVAGLLAPIGAGAAATPLQAALAIFVQPEARAAMLASLSAQIAAPTHARVDTAAMTSLE